jgi:hypothetical protein
MNQLDRSLNKSEPVSLVEHNRILLRDLRNLKLQWQTPSEFMEEETYLKGKPYRFRQHEFLRQIMDDQNKIIVVKKATQVGITETMTRKLLYFILSNKYVKGLYVLPRGSLLHTYSSTKLAPTLTGSPAFQGAIDPALNNVLDKQFGTSYLILRSSWDISLGQVVDADAMVFDENDLMKPEVETTFQERIAHSEYGFLWRVGWPSIPHFGIAKYYSDSTQNEWQVKCESCGQWQEITLNSIKNDLYCCFHCGAELNREQGKWVSGQPDAEISGYHISQLIAPWISAKALLKKREDYELDRDFHNFVLGLEYEGPSVKIIGSDDVWRCQNHTYFWGQSFPGSYMVLGVDWGEPSFVIIASVHDRTLIPVHMERITDNSQAFGLAHTKRVIELMNKYKVNKGVGDFGFGETKNAGVDNATHRFWTCLYADEYKNPKPSWDEKNRMVKVNRDTSLRLTFQAVRMENRLQIPFESVIHPEVKEMALQANHIVTVREESRESGTGLLNIHERITRTGADHYWHALNYCFIAASQAVTGENRIESGGSLDSALPDPVEYQRNPELQ